MRWWMLLTIGCGASRTAVDSEVPSSTAGEGTADVVSVAATGSTGAYTFAVELRSDDTGCEQYADWWEVVDASGALVYRRILGHSHVDEQPFTRSGGPVDVEADATLWIRGHLAPGGYGGVVFTGSVADGFVAGEALVDADDLASQAPLPAGCAF